MSSAVAILALGVVASGTPVVRDNYLEFHGLDTIGWHETLHTITEGQPYDGVEAFDASIRIKAGREDSPGPATDFFEGLNFNEHVMGLAPYKAKKPEQLNFASFGTLTATFPTGDTRTCDGFRIGQGHEGSHNDWWIASDKCIQTKKDGFVCEPCGIAFTTSGKDHLINVHEIEVNDGFDNYLDFKGAASIEWKEASHSVTAGQAYEGVSTHGASMDVKAGRSGSSGPATDFFDGLDAETNVIGVSTGAGARLSNLNFATTGTLTAKFPYGITKTCENIRVGQSGEGDSKNWWIGSKDCVQTGLSLACEACGVTFATGPNEHSVQISSMGPDAIAV